MQLAYAAGRTGGTMPAVLNAANEQAVELFLKGSLSYLEISSTIEKTCDLHIQEHTATPGLEDILHADQWARETVFAMVGSPDLAF
jgi:1-deoxy-D-xylulose-5-phosphate reductoisomerase